MNVRDTKIDIENSHLSLLWNFDWRRISLYYDMSIIFRYSLQICTKKMCNNSFSQLMTSKNTEIPKIAVYLYHTFKIRDSLVSDNYNSICMLYVYVYKMEQLFDMFLTIILFIVIVSSVPILTFIVHMLLQCIVLLMYEQVTMYITIKNWILYIQLYI